MGSRGTSRRDTEDPRLASLATHAPSQVPAPRALRAREVSSPTAQDLAEAESTVQIRLARPVEAQPAARRR